VQFDDPNQTMFVALPTSPNGRTLVEFQTINGRQAWRKGDGRWRRWPEDKPFLYDQTLPAGYIQREAWRRSFRKKR
jgi:hypothetical protein